MNRQPDFEEITMRLEMACKAVHEELKAKPYENIVDYVQELESKMDKVADSFIVKHKDSEIATTLKAVIETYKRRCIKDFEINKK